MDMIAKRIAALGVLFPGDVITVQVDVMVAVRMDGQDQIVIKVGSSTYSSYVKQILFHSLATSFKIPNGLNCIPLSQ